MAQPLKGIEKCHQHYHAFARDNDLKGQLYCPECKRVLTRTESVNVFLTLMRKAARLIEPDKVPF